MNYPHMQTIRDAPFKLLMQATALSDQPTPAELDSLATGFDAAQRTTCQLTETHQSKSLDANPMRARALRGEL